VNGTAVFSRRASKKLAASICAAGCLTMALAMTPSASADAVTNNQICVHLAHAVANALNVPDASRVAECTVIP
jgi:hypothetical protein